MRGRRSNLAFRIGPAGFAAMVATLLCVPAKAAGADLPEESDDGAKASEKVAPETVENAEKRTPNRLAKEKSPYLLQHQYNPVDWYPWGDEAFEKARRENKPIFLSIGYSTCHWCHVMERESFEDEEIAAYLNKHFVAVKVDREERPDVDGVYMDAVTAITGRGGWPLSAFLTADRLPFYGGTYFPPRAGARGAQMGFLELCQKVVEVWSTNRAQIETSANQLRTMIENQSTVATGSATVEPKLVRRAYDALVANYDPEHGGFRGPPRHAPKFPRTSVLDLLLRYAQTKDAQSKQTAADALEMVFTSLDKMIHGGIRDHLAGGFHRYSVDRIWLVPHFEKMLYDQALIARTLVDAYRISRNQQYLAVAREIMDYVRGRMTGPSGELYSAEDADTNHVEGLTYTWTRKEVLRVVGSEDGESFCAYYGITPEGNFEEGGEHVNILSIPDPSAFARIAAERKLSEAELSDRFAAARARLLAVRDERPQPLRDDKVLTAWNGLGISALAYTYQVTRDEVYLTAAQRAAAFVKEHLAEGGHLKRRYRAGEVRFPGYLNDYAFLADGLLDLFESDFDPRWLEWANRLAGTLLSDFLDSESGTFFTTSAHQEKLIVRQREFYDGAVPSGNSVALSVLLRLGQYTDDAKVLAAARKLEGAAAALAVRAPASYPALLCAAYYRMAEPKQLVIAGDAASTASWRDAVYDRFLPAKILVRVPGGGANAKLAALVPLVEGKLAIAGSPTAYVCRDKVCKLPAKELDTFLKQLAAP